MNILAFDADDRAVSFLGRPSSFENDYSLDIDPVHLAALGATKLRLVGDLTRQQAEDIARAEWRFRWPDLPPLDEALEADPDVLFHPGDPEDLENDPPISLCDHALHMAAVLLPPCEAVRTPSTPGTGMEPDDTGEWEVADPDPEPGHDSDHGSDPGRDPGLEKPESDVQESWRKILRIDLESGPAAGAVDEAWARRVISALEMVLHGLTAPLLLSPPPENARFILRALLHERWLTFLLRKPRGRSEQAFFSLQMPELEDGPLVFRVEEPSLDELLLLLTNLPAHVYAGMSFGEDAARWVLSLVDISVKQGRASAVRVRRPGQDSRGAG